MRSLCYNERMKDEILSILFFASLMFIVLYA